MNGKATIWTWIKNDWVIGLFLLGIFLATNGYTYAWDDQHLEIPLLKSLIDPALYQDDYYVEGLKKNFPSYFFPILAKIISVDQVPAAYLVLYLISRYFLFFWMYKFWRLIIRGRGPECHEKNSSSGVRPPLELLAALCVVTIMTVGRVEEFIYRTFSHQEFALAIIMAGIYYFYKERFILAAILFGVAANVHAIYSLFPMAYMTVYLVWQNKRHSWRVFGKCILAFLICGLPFVVLALQKRFFDTTIINPNIYRDWISLYKIACPQNFTFLENPLPVMMRNLGVFMKGTQAYWILISLYIVNCLHHERFKKDLKSQAIFWTGVGFILLSFIFSYVVPNRFVLDLNLVRNSQFMLLILIGYTTVLFFDVDKKRWPRFIAAGILFPLIRFGSYMTTYIGVLLAAGLALVALWEKGERNARWMFYVSLLSCIVAVALGLMINELFVQKYSMTTKWGLAVIYLSVAVMAGVRLKIKEERLIGAWTNLVILIPFIVIFFNSVQYHVKRLQIESTAGGFWQTQRNWIDMQKYVKAHTPKSAYLLVPNDMEMGGFRIFSERKIICCYRDCGIIGFDYRAAVEWERRLKDIDSFKVIAKTPISSAIITAIVKYRVNYIVFMRYLNPGNNNPLLEPVYSNDVFSLYRVKGNPL